MSNYPPPDQAQQGYQRTRPTRVQPMAPGDNSVRPRARQQPQLGRSPLDMLPDYLGDVSASLIPDNELGVGNSRARIIDDEDDEDMDMDDANEYGAPMLGMGNQNQYGAGVGTNSQPFYGGSSGFAAINTAHGAPANYMAPAAAAVPMAVAGTSSSASSPPPLSPAQPPPATRSGMPQQRPKRKSKYTDEPPQSIYGPPFITKELTAEMTEEEQNLRRKYNENVMEARKVFMRHKNNMAAKKSRERKQALIDELTAENRRLESQLREANAANRQLCADSLRLQTTEAENAQLRQNNEVLQRHVEELETRLHGVTVERQRDADRLNAMLSLPQGQAHAGNGIGNGSGNGYGQGERQIHTPMTSSSSGESPALGPVPGAARQHNQQQQFSVNQYQPRQLQLLQREPQNNAEEEEVGTHNQQARDINTPAGMNPGMDPFLTGMDNVDADADDEAEFNWDDYR